MVSRFNLIHIIHLSLRHLCRDYHSGIENALRRSFDQRIHFIDIVGIAFGHKTPTGVKRANHSHLTYPLYLPDMIAVVLDQLRIARLEVGLLKALDERLNLGRISFRNVIALGHPRSPRAQSRPSASIGQVRIGSDSLLSRRATAGRQILGRMPSLEKIEFWECAGITDAGVALQAGLPRLRAITVGGSPNVTRKGMAVFPSAVRVNYW